jgi:hypothetical protein
VKDLSIIAQTLFNYCRNRFLLRLFANAQGDKLYVILNAVKDLSILAADPI